MRFAPRLTAFYLGRALQGSLTVGTQVLIFRLFGAAIFADIGFFALLPTLMGIADQLFLNEILTSIDWSNGSCQVQSSRLRQTAIVNVIYALGIATLTTLALWLISRAFGHSQAADNHGLGYIFLACSSSALWWSVSFWTNFAAAVDRPILSQTIGISAPLGRCIVIVLIFVLRVKQAIDIHIYVVSGIAALLLFLIWMAYFVPPVTGKAIPPNDRFKPSLGLLIHLWKLNQEKRSILLASLATAIYNMVDKIMFWTILPKVLYGKYLLISQLVAVVSLFAGPIYSAAVPILNRSFQNSPVAIFRKHLTQTLLGTAVVLIILSLLCLAGSDRLLYRAFGQDSSNALLRLAYGTTLSAYMASISIYVPWAVLCFRGEAQLGTDIFAAISMSYIAIALLLFRAHLPALILPVNMAMYVIQSSLILRRFRFAVWGRSDPLLAFKAYPALLAIVTCPGILACWQNANQINL